MLTLTTSQSKPQCQGQLYTELAVGLRQPVTSRNVPDNIGTEKGGGAEV